MIDFGLLKAYVVDAFLHSAQPSVQTQLEQIRSVGATNKVPAIVKHEPHTLFTLRDGAHPAAKALRHS